MSIYGADNTTNEPVSDVSARVEALASEVQRVINVSAGGPATYESRKEAHDALAELRSLALQAEEAQRELTRADGDGVRLLREKQAAEQRLGEMEREANAGYEGRDFWKSACEDERKKVGEMEAALREIDTDSQKPGISAGHLGFLARRALASATPEERVPDVILDFTTGEVSYPKRATPEVRTLNPDPDIDLSEGREIHGGIRKPRGATPEEPT